MSRRFGNSLRLRGTGLVLIVVAAFWILAAGMTWRAAVHEAAEIFDGHLAQAASMLIAQTALEIEEDDDGEFHAPLAHRYARKVAFQVWENGEKLLVHSQNAPATRLGETTDGFSDSLIDGERWRVFSTWSAKRRLLIQVGERAEAREDLADEVAFGSLAPLSWTLPILGILIWWAIGHVLRPLTVLGKELAERSPDRLEPVVVADLPSEVEPLVDRLNQLLNQVQTALGTEKRFTGDAAHELRTPIAALSAQAQVALAESDPQLRHRALEHVLLAAERMTRLVEQLLTLARADNALSHDWPEIDLIPLVQEVLAESVPAGLPRHIDVELESPESIFVKGERGWLRILLRNLIDNAIRHSPPSGVVRVFLHIVNKRVSLEIADQGPGVDASRMSMLGQRFWRGQTEAGDNGTGSGLGISIVKKIADLHRAQVHFQTGKNGGLVASVLFEND